MKTSKVLRRLSRLDARPQLLERVARDVGVALAHGDREGLSVVVRGLATNAPDSDGGDPELAYWAGFAAAMGMLLASYEAAHEPGDARAAAMRALGSPSAKAVLGALADMPQTGAELAKHLQLTPGAVSKILKSLRGVGLVRVLGGPTESESIPERGAPKPHALTPLGIGVAGELAASAVAEEPSYRAAVR